MNKEHKINLQKALISQTWNKELTGEVISAIETDLKQPKSKPEPSKLRLAIEKENKKRLNSLPFLTNDSED